MTARLTLSCPHGGATLDCGCCHSYLVRQAAAELIEIINAASGPLAGCTRLNTLREGVGAAVNEFVRGTLAAGIEHAAESELERRLRG